MDERELWGQKYIDIYIFTPHTIEKIYERYMHASILLQHLATAPLDTRQLHELVRDICLPPGTFVSSASSTTRRNLTLSPFQDSPASTPNISQPRSWIHAHILIQGLIASPLDMPHRGGAPWLGRLGIMRRARLLSSFFCIASCGWYAIAPYGAYYFLWEGTRFPITISYGFYGILMAVLLFLWCPWYFLWFLRRLLMVSMPSGLCKGYVISCACNLLLVLREFPMVFVRFPKVISKLFSMVYAN